MRKVLLSGFLTAAFILGQTAFAALPVGGPPNDDFVSATPVLSLPYDDSRDTTLATTEQGERADCFTPAKSIWYSYTTTSDAGLQAIAASSALEFTRISVFTGSSLSSLTLVTCGVYGFAFKPAANTTYYFQVDPGLSSVGNTFFSLSVTGSISGRFTDSNGVGLSECWIDFLGSGYGYGGGYYYTQSGSDGTYVVDLVDAGDYAMNYTCHTNDNFVYGSYNGTVHVDSGIETTGIDVVVDITPPPPPPPPIDTDLAVTSLKVTPVPITTDNGNVGYTGWMRDIAVDVSNLSKVNVHDALLAVATCPAGTSLTVGDGNCQIVGQEFLDLHAGAAVSRSFRWSAFRQVGDIDVIAFITVPCQYEDTDWSNNAASVHSYSMVGGTGVYAGFGGPVYLGGGYGYSEYGYCSVIAMPVAKPAH